LRYPWTVSRQLPNFDDGEEHPPPEAMLVISTTEEESDDCFAADYGLKSDICAMSEKSAKRHFATQNNIEPFRRRTKVIRG
jgi:hypothetical protein